MQEITSVSNNQIKDTVKLQQKKYRQEKGLFLVEGFKPIFEAYQEKAEIETVYVSNESVKKFDFVNEKLVLVTDAIMEKISTTDSSPEAVAVVKQIKTNIEQIKDKTRIALLENVKDAGNLGTLMRSAAAFGIEAIILSGDTIDPFNPKVVRSTVGALFKLPIVKSSITKTKEIFASHSFISTVVNHKDIVNPETVDFSKPFVLMLGSEADGLSEEAIAVSDVKTTIPMSKNTESLNLSVAGSILFYISSKNCF